MGQYGHTGLVVFQQKMAVLHYSLRAGGGDKTFPPFPRRAGYASIITFSSRRRTPVPGVCLLL